MCIYVYICTCTFICEHSHENVCIYVHTQTYVNAYSKIYMYIIYTKNIKYI